jgi:hypothetical protein
MVQFDCPKRCCNVKYCPLVLAWATTIHKFQGFEAGFNTPIERIIADMGTLDWEKKNPGTAYVVASRAQTIGTNTEDWSYPQDSNLYFSGTLGEARFTECRFKMDGTVCLKIKQRDEWVEYLSTKINETKERRPQGVVEHARNFVMNTIKNDPIANKTDLHTRIVSILKTPNEQWMLRRQQCVL